MIATFFCAQCRGRATDARGWFWITPVGDSMERVLVCSRSCGEGWFHEPAQRRGESLPDGLPLFFDDEARGKA